MATFRPSISAQTAPYHAWLVGLDLIFQQPNLCVALPAQLVLPQLHSLSLHLRGPDAEAFGTDLLACVDSPLHHLAVTARMSTRPALCGGKATAPGS